MSINPQVKHFLSSRGTHDTSDHFQAFHHERSHLGTLISSKTDRTPRRPILSESKESRNQEKYFQ